MCASFGKNELMNGWMDGQRDGWTFRGIDGRIEGWMDGQRDGWTDGGMDGRTEGWMDGQRDGWTDRGMDGRTEGWMDGQRNGGTDRGMDGGTEGWMDGQRDGWRDRGMDVWVNGWINDWWMKRLLILNKCEGRNTKIMTGIFISSGCNRIITNKCFCILFLYLCINVLRQLECSLRVGSLPWK